MQEKLSYFKKKRFVFGVIFLVIVLFSVVLFKNHKNGVSTVTVKYSDFVNQVLVSGKVVASENVELAFKTGGLIEKTYFKVGEKVKKGQTIASLDSTDAKGTLEIAKANYQKVLNGATTTDINVVKSEVQVAQVALEQAKAQQDILVKNAKKNLLNSGFVVIAEDDQINETPPSVSGSYLKDVEGMISIEQYNSSGGTSFKTSGIVNAVGMVNTEIPQPIGDTGLYIKFPNTTTSTKWIVNIPDKKSSRYLENLNAYETALSNQTQAIANASAVFEKAKASLLLKETDARPEDVASAYGSLLVAESSYNDKFIFAPFDGVITVMDAKAGEIASPNIPLISMIGDETFQVESYVPEVNIAKIAIGNDAKITLDAYGENVFFDAKVVAIDPAETIRNGVSTYKTKLQFVNKDDRIKSGMTANVAITVFSKPNVLVVPGGVVFQKDGKNFIQIKNDKKVVDREVVLGESSSLGQVEIVSGVSEGENVILNPTIK